MENGNGKMEMRMETWREIVESVESMRATVDHGKFLVLNPLCERFALACKTLEDLLIVEQDENAKLRRALEPVMKCDVPKSCICTCRDEEAVREAQAIMKGDSE